jgi:hypothetical protein
VYFNPIDMKISFTRSQAILLLFFTILSFSSRLSAQYPSDSAQISLLTLSPGSETYAAFGHSAIHVADPRTGIDFVYNYGTFDFSTSNFYFKFGFGRLMYFLSIDDYRDFYLSYKMWGQGMWEQKLNLTNKEKWQLISNLQKNYQIENRFYRYGFFRDNCSTRIRDIIEKSVDGKIVYDAAYVKKPESFRQLFSAYLEQREPWALFGMDLLMGKGTDSIAGIRDYMFLPENLMHLYATAKISNHDTLKNLAGKPIELFPSTLSFPKPNPSTSPVAVFWGLFFVVLGFTYVGFRKHRYFKWFDVLIFLVTGLLGLLLLILMIGTLHSELLRNYNIVWANPMNLIFVAGLFFRSKPLWFQYLIRAYGIMLIIFIPLSFLLTQVIPGAAYPLIGVLLVRTMKLIYSQK